MALNTAQAAPEMLYSGGEIYWRAGCKSTEQVREGPHYEFGEDVRIEELDVSSTADQGVQASSLQGDVEIDIAAQQHTVLGGRCPYLVQVFVQHLEEKLAFFRVVS